MTERTFFRHFPDKREVLFDGQARLQEMLAIAIAAAPGTLRPLQVLNRAFRSVERVLDDNRSFYLPRQHVIASTPALQERELAKVASLVDGLALALRRRGVDDRLATLAAQTGMAAFRYAIASWFADATHGLGSDLDRAFDELDGLASPLASRKARRRR